MPHALKIHPASGLLLGICALTACFGDEFHVRPWNVSASLFDVLPLMDLLLLREHFELANFVEPDRRY